LGKYADTLKRYLAIFHKNGRRTSRIPAWFDEQWTFEIVTAKQSWITPPQSTETMAR